MILSLKGWSTSSKSRQPLGVLPALSCKKYRSKFNLPLETATLYWIESVLIPGYVLFQRLGYLVTSTIGVEIRVRLWVSSINRNGLIAIDGNDSTQSTVRLLQLQKKNILNPDHMNQILN